MNETTTLMSTVSQIFMRLLPIFILLVLIFVVLVLIELAKFFKKLETTSVKMDNLNDKIAGMQMTFETSLEEPELLNMRSYSNLQFKSAIANQALGFGLDNSEEIIGWSHKILSTYKRFKRKREK